MKVPPHGPQTAEFVVIGEAPGATEMREGRPFCGPSGELLASTLRDVGLDLAEVYVTNVVKEYRHGNPTPTTEEIKEALPELIAELAALPNIKHVLLVGNVPLQAVTGRKGGILKTQGELLTPRKDLQEALDGVDIMAVMHPAYVLRNNNMPNTSLFSQVLGSFVQLGKPTMDETVVIVDDFGKWSDFVDDLRDSPRGAIDLETTPVPWWDPDHKLVSAAISFDGKTAYAFDLQDRGDRHNLFTLLGEADTKWVMHNGKFDRQVLLHYGCDVPLIFDTMAAQYLIDPSARKGLEHLSSVYLGLPPYKDVDYKNILDEDPHKVMRMNGIDAIRTMRLYTEILKPRVAKDQRVGRLFVNLMMPAINTLLELELKGMPIDVGLLDDVTQRYEADLARQEAVLQDIGRKYGVEDLNPRSITQMQDLLFNKVGLFPTKMTPKGSPSLDKEVLLDLKGHPVVDAYAEYKITAQRIGTFLHPWADMESGGLVFPGYKPTTVVSGRLSSEKPNIQQVPKDPDIRGIFGGVPGYSIVSLDYSQLELRIAAALAGEKAMLEAYRTGADLHTLTAERVLRDASARQTGKILNFSLLYGAAPRMLQHIAWVQYGLRLTDSEAAELHAGFFMAYPGLKVWAQGAIAQAKKDGYTQSLLGRRRYLPNINDRYDDKRRKHDEKVALNHPVQSLASDLMLHSLVEMHREFHDEDARVIATVHDSALLLVKDDLATHVSEIARHIMERATPALLEARFGFELGVPFVADVTINTHWRK